STAMNERVGAELDAKLDAQIQGMLDESLAETTDAIAQKQKMELKASVGEQVEQNRSNQNVDIDFAFDHADFLAGTDAELKAAMDLAILEYDDYFAQQEYKAKNAY